jgi:ribosomal protein S6--L-glutamate ligase
MVKMEKFSEFITEEKDEPYKIVVLYHSGESSIGGIPSHKEEHGTLKKLVQDSAKKVGGIEIFNVDFNGMHISEKDNKTYINSFPFDEEEGAVILPNLKDDDITYEKPFQIDSSNTIIMPRGLGTLGFTASQYWVDTIKNLENLGYLTIPSIKCWEICSSKYMTDVICRQNDILTPKTVPITHASDTERAFEELKTKFPIILKASIGTQTGIGVIIVESMRSLNAIVQTLLLYNKYLPILLQEYIEADWDVRVVTLDKKILGAMKRKVIKGDFRSNVSIGAETENIKLTDLEVEYSLKAAEVVHGRLAGVDFIPSKNREKELPYILEVNSMPGFGGIEKLNKGLTAEIFKYFKNRDNWNLDKSTET